MKVLEKVVDFGKNIRKKGLTYVLLVGLAGSGFSCATVSELRGRLASPPGLGPLISFLNFENLGLHGSRLEGRGQVYTCNGGQIDIDHTRNAIDRTRYLSEKTFKYLIENKENKFSSKFVEPSLYFVEFSYPENWKNLLQNEKEQIAYDLSVKVGGYVTYASLTWHEILTWFGYSKIFPEFASSFTWEDNFSNILGTHLAIQVLQDIHTFDKKTFDKAMTLVLDKELRELGVQSKESTKRAIKKVRGSWFSGLLGLNIKKRHFDIGLDGYVTPFLIPDVSKCSGAKPKSYPVPSLDFLFKYGFSMRFEIEMHEWEKDKIYRILGGKRRVNPEKDFPKIMDYIRRDALKRGYKVD